MRVTKISPFVPAKRKEIPMMLAHVEAGFPSPADDYMESRIDINDLFLVDEATTFYTHAHGESMINEGIQNGDVLCIRKDLEPRDGDIVVGIIDGEFLLKRLRKTSRGIVFESANENFPDIIPGDGQSVDIWGVVTGLARVINRPR